MFIQEVTYGSQKTITTAVNFTDVVVTRLSYAFDVVDIFKQNRKLLRELPDKRDRLKYAVSLRKQSVEQASNEFIS